MGGCQKCQLRLVPNDTRWHTMTPCQYKKFWESGGYSVNYCHGVL